MKKQASFRLFFLVCSVGRDRTYDQFVNSELLYRWATTEYFILERWTDYSFLKHFRRVVYLLVNDIFEAKLLELPRNMVVETNIALLQTVHIEINPNVSIIIQEKERFCKTLFCA